MHSSLLLHDEVTAIVGRLFAKNTTGTHGDKLTGGVIKAAEPKDNLPPSPDSRPLSSRYRMDSSLGSRFRRSHRVEDPAKKIFVLDVTRICDLKQWVL